MTAKYSRDQQHRIKTTKVTKTLVTASLLLAGSFLPLHPAQAQTSPISAGQTIENTARGSFVDPESNTTKSVVSNTVTLTVREIAGVIVTANGSNLPASANVTDPGVNQNNASINAGDVVNFRFLITNIGNDPTSIFIPSAPSSVTGGTFELAKNPIRILEIDPDGTGTATAQIINQAVPAGGINSYNFINAGGSPADNWGFIPPGGTILVEVPIRVNSGLTPSQAIAVTLGETTPANTNNVDFSAAAANFNVATVDLADGTSNPHTGNSFTETNGAPVIEKEGSGTQQTTYTGEPDDYGDAPNSYGTTRSSDFLPFAGAAAHTFLTGANLTTSKNLYIGSVPPDTEANGTSATTGDPAVGDDTNQSINDEEGVTLPSVNAAATSYTAQVKVTNNTGNNAYLVGWIDWNKNGSFDTTEQVVYDADPNTSGIQPITTSATPLNLDLTWNLSSFAPLPTGATYARFRLASDLAEIQDKPTGRASDGEVEDYKLAIAQSIDLELRKTADDTTPAVGETVTFTLTLKNKGPNTANNVVVRDLIPAGLTYVGNNGGAATTYNTGTQTLDWAIASLASGATVSLQITATVDSTGNATTNPVITNTAEVINADETDIDSTPNNNIPTEDDQGTVVLNGQADLELTKTVNDSSLNDGEPIIFTITVQNKGGSNGTNIVVTDLLPNTVTFGSSTTATGTYNNTTGIWEIPYLANGATATLTINGTMAIAGLVKNIAEITAADQTDIDSTPNNYNTQPTEDDGDIAVVNGSDLELTKTILTPPTAANNQITFRITLTNQGPLDGTGIEVEDQLPTGLNYVSHTTATGTYDDATGVWDVGNLSATTPNNVAILDIVATIDTSNAIENMAQVTAADLQDPDSTPNNYTSTPPNEDDEDVVKLNTDFGDAPDTYLTTLNNGGAYHGITANLRIGGTPDFEPDGQPNPTASGDDETGIDDEGLGTVPILQAGDSTYSLNLEVTNKTGTNAKLIGWIDFDKDGTFEPDEAVAIAVPTGTDNGTITLTWDISDVNVTDGASYLRLRLTTDAAISLNTPGGGATDGEVEDYQILFRTAASSEIPNVILVKRITAVNGQAINPNDSNQNFDTYIDSPSDLNDDAIQGWPTPLSTYLKGLIDNVFIQNNDTIDFTIYFLSNSKIGTQNFSLCDMVPSNTVFVSEAFGGGKGIGLGFDSTDTTLPVPSAGGSPPPIALTNNADSDSGTFYPPQTQPANSCRIVRNDPNNPQLLLNELSPRNAAENGFGAVVVDLGDLSFVDNNLGSGGTDKTNYYGFIRFRVRYDGN